MSARESSEDDRDARLAALLSVDIDARPSSQPSEPESEPASEPESEAASEAASGHAREKVPAPSPDPASTAVPGRPPRWRRLAAAVSLVALIVSGVALAYVGTRIVRNSTEGRVVTPIDDPSAPGFEALVDPTPTLVVLHDTGGIIDAITVLTLPDPDGGGGGVLMVPTRTIHELPVFDVNPIEYAYDLGDPAFQADVVGRLLGAAMLESTVVDTSRWADLVAPVAPLGLDNPNELVVDGEVRFPAGEIELGAADIGPYLEATVEGESDLARLFRHETFWTAWIDAVAADGTDAAVPGELDQGLARFVRTLARDRADVETLPVQPAAEGRYGPEPAFVPRFDEVRSLLQRFVPFPVSPAPGVRARLRVLNGTTDVSEAAAVAARLPPAGVEVVLVGNAATLDHSRTRIGYFGAEFRNEAEAVAEILGVGEVFEEDRPSDTVDITVTLGADHD